MKDTANSAKGDTIRVINEGANVLTLGEINKQKDREREEQKRRLEAEREAAFH